MIKYPDKNTPDTAARSREELFRNHQITKRKYKQRQFKLSLYQKLFQCIEYVTLKVLVYFEFSIRIGWKRLWMTYGRIKIVIFLKLLSVRNKHKNYMAATLFGNNLTNLLNQIVKSIPLVAH